jgi:nucleotide-binding universal stress UspA family protein
MMVAMKRILVPTDFSETSDAALKYGIGLAQAFSARLYLLHVPKSGVNFEADFPMVQFETAPQERLETLVSEQEARELRPEYALRIGAPSDQIVRYAGDRDIDLIVMGTHGRSGMPHMVLGSVAEKVLRAAPCPVLTVRPPRRASVGTRAEEATAQTAPERQEAGSRMLHRVSRLRGTDVQGVDGYIGRVEGFYFDDAQWTIRYIVVNAGSWLTRHPLLISPEAVKPDWGLAGFNLTLTREQVRNSPEIDLQGALARQDEERLLGHFGHSLYWKADGRSGSTPNLCSTKEVTGDHIQASDGEIGHVDDFLIDEASWRVDYLVVDTSNWIGGRWVLIAPTTLKGIDWPNSTLQVGLNREAVRNSPSIDAVAIAPGEDGPPFMIL